MVSTFYDISTYIEFSNTSTQEDFEGNSFRYRLDLFLKRNKAFFLQIGKCGTSLHCLFQFFSPSARKQCKWAEYQKLLDHRAIVRKEAPLTDQSPIYLCFQQVLFRYGGPLFPNTAQQTSEMLLEPKLSHDADALDAAYGPPSMCEAQSHREAAETLLTFNREEANDNGEPCSSIAPSHADAQNLEDMCMAHEGPL